MGQGPFAVSLSAHLENEHTQLPEQGLCPCWYHGEKPIPDPIINTASDVSKITF